MSIVSSPETIDQTTEPYLACEGRLHAIGHEGHIPAQPAAGIVDLACPHCKMRVGQFLLCEGRLHWLEAMPTDVECVICGRSAAYARFRRNFIPLAQPTAVPSSPRSPDRGTPNQSGDDATRGQRKPLPPRLDSPPPATPTPADTPAQPSWSEALAGFDEQQRAKGLSERTIQNRRWILEATARATETAPCDITVQQLRTRLGRGLQRSSMQSERDAYRALFAFLYEDGIRPDDLGALLPPIRAPRRMPRPYTPEQIEALLTAGDKGPRAATRAMILLGAFQGFRVSEIAAVHGHDVDLDAGTLRVLGKGGKHATLPLHPTIRKIALEMPRDGYWFPDRSNGEGHILSHSVSDLIKRAKVRAGITNPRLTPHSLRHSYGTNLVRAGVDLRTVQELMRHESLATTQIYTAVDADQMRDGIDRLAPWEPAAVLPEAPDA